MRSQAEKAGAGNEPVGATLSDLALPHAKFPFCSRASLYDMVTGMYLDCWDDAEIARSLASEYRCDISQATVNGLRIEASSEAEARHSPELKRKWIYRYKHLTVNNLVKEYMFLEGKEDFLRAKRDLADEIDLLVRTSSADRLWIAVNDALGRNNISEDLIQKLLAYGKTARKLEAAISDYEKARSVTFKGGIGEVAAMIAALHGKADGQDARNVARFMAILLACEETAFCVEDVDFCIDYNKQALLSSAVAGSPAFRVMHGADVVEQEPDVLDQVLSGIAHDLSSSEILKLVELVRKGPLLSKGQGERIKAYAARHVSDDEMRKKLAVIEASSRKRQEEMASIQILLTAVDDHLSLREAKTFFSPQEIARAESRGIIEPHLQALLNKLNLLRSMGAVVAQINEQQLQTKFEFPSERYCQRRFGEYSQQGFGAPKSFWNK